LEHNSRTAEALNSGTENEVVLMESAFFLSFFSKGGTGVDFNSPDH